VSPRETILADINRAASLSDLFVGRSDLIRLFCTRLQEEPETRQVIFFHGDGGNGKSSLLRFLRDKCCKLLYPHHWLEAIALADPEFVDKVVRAPVKAPALWAELDLADRLHGEETRSPLGGVKTLRRALAGRGLRFPVYDFAYACYLRKAGRLTKEELQSGLGVEAAGLASDLLGALSRAPGAEVVGIVFELAVKRLGGEFEIWRRRRGVDKAYLQGLLALDQHGLGLRLPELLALDLLASTALEDAPKRVVLFIDGHECLTAPESTPAAFQVSSRDEWLRRLIKPLLSPEGRRILVVVAGRMPPDWSRALGDHAIDTQHVLSRPVLHLSPADSREYLRRRGITDRALQDAIVAYTQVSAGEVHPFYLSLCADTVAFAMSREGRVIEADEFRQVVQTARRGEETLGRLLSQVGRDFATAIIALSGCRGFDYDIYAVLGRALDFPPDRITFNVLTSSFSFVWRSEDERGTRYRIHDLVRRLVREGKPDGEKPVMDPGIVRQADGILEAHYRSKAASGSPASIAEAIYHAYQLEPGRATEEWLDLLESNKAQGDYALGQALLAIRGDITPADPHLRGRVAAESGRYLGSLARHEEAEAEFRIALLAYDEALALGPDEAGIHRSKANALWRFGEFLAQLSRHGKAEEVYGQAVAACDQALRLAPDDAELHRNKGAALYCLGDLRAVQSRRTDAEALYTQAIASCDQALRLAPGDFRAHNSRGVALRGLGNLRVPSLPGEAEKLYTQAIEAYGEALRLAPDDVRVHNNRGAVLISLGNLLAPSLPGEAEKLYTQAIGAYDQALRIAPDFVLAHNNKGNALRCLGDLLAPSLPGEAEKLYTQAIGAYDKALRLAPDRVEALTGKARACIAVGQCMPESRSSEARRYWVQAQECVTRALELRPNYEPADWAKWEVEELLGDVSASADPR
jgi:tetratricopeptide (TPR) repeat protein